jgi:hypothetical protein
VSKRVFISYRREDTGAAAGRLYDRLLRLLPRSHVFYDVNTIRGGEDFETKTLSEIARSDVALIFIGKKWLEPEQPSNKARIWQPNDYVRSEVRAALARPLLVIPILVGGTRMPRAEEIPEDVRALSKRSALLLTHENFDADAENILATILDGSSTNRIWNRKSRTWSKILYGCAGALAASALMLIGALVHFWLLARPLSASIGEPLTQILLTVVLVLGVWIGLRCESVRANR